MQKSFPDLLNLLAWVTNELSCAHVTNPHLEAELFLTHVLSVDKSELYINESLSLTKENQEDLFSKVEKRKQGSPLQYLIGKVLFYDCVLEVNEHVLIPRPETELLCEKIVDLRTPGSGQRTILDIGTGSGAIAIALAKHCPNVHVLGVDISQQAIDLAKENIKHNKVEKQVKVKQANIFEGLDKKEKFDLIISNPPYIKTQELNDLPIDVKQEPGIALDGGEQGVCFYKAILEKAKQYLKPNGFIAFEIGETQAQAIIAEAKGQEFSLMGLEKDYADRERYLFFN